MCSIFQRPVGYFQVLSWVIQNVFTLQILLGQICPAEHVKHTSIQTTGFYSNTRSKTLILSSLIWMWVITWLKALSRTNPKLVLGHALALYLTGFMMRSESHDAIWCPLTTRNTTAPKHLWSAHLWSGVHTGICPVCTLQFSRNMQKVCKMNFVLIWLQDTIPGVVQMLHFWVAFSKS